LSVFEVKMGFGLLKKMKDMGITSMLGKVPVVGNIVSGVASGVATLIDGVGLPDNKPKWRGSSSAQAMGRPDSILGIASAMIQNGPIDTGISGEEYEREWKRTHPPDPNAKLFEHSPIANSPLLDILRKTKR
jgi:hypothetical protein